MTDLSQVRERLQATWAAGDFHQLGVEQLIVGERLCEEVGMRAGQRVLDVACGAGNTTLAAARRRALATGCDWVPALLERAEQRAKAEGLKIEWVKADAEDLPFPDGSFDIVLSTFGVMFAADHQRLEAIDQLVTAGTPVNQADAEWGRLPLHVAAGSGRPASVRRLLGHGADPNLRDPRHHRTPLEECQPPDGNPDSPGHQQAAAILRAVAREQDGSRSPP